MNRDVIVIGASAGGIEPLIELVSDLPADLPATVAIVVHTPPTSSSRLHLILGRKTPLPVMVAQDGIPMMRGRIYVAPPDQHLVLQGAVVGLSRGPRENYSRPSIDVLFRSAAVNLGARVIGVVLSGAMGDGVAGLRAIKAVGGLAVVQDPDDAVFRDLPQRATVAAEIDHVVPAAEIGALLGQLVAEPLPDLDVMRPVPVQGVRGDRLRRELEVEMTALEHEEGVPPSERVGTPSAFGCPECGGVLWEIEDGDLIRFRCRVGHAYSAHSLLEGELRSIEDALWIAIRALEEHAELHERLAARTSGRGLQRTSAEYAERAAEARHQAQLIRRAILRLDLRRNEDASGDELASSASAISQAGHHTGSG